MMPKECRYVSRNEVKEYKKIIEEVIPKVKNDIKGEFGASFNHQIVGSARRNLVVQQGNGNWDVDYQFMFLSKEFNRADPWRLKKGVQDSFMKHLGEAYSVKMSTSVITICLLDQKGKNAKKSFDIALIKNNERTGNKEILRGKNFDKSSEEYIKWEELKKSKAQFEARHKIKGTEMWKEFRDKFLEKKSKNVVKNKDLQKPTFSIYLEAIDETLKES
ncbi:MAG: hypothetical protein ACRC1F_02820 [Metamycoplasmataceae bacterium]